MDNLSDEQLVKNYLKGDNQALEFLIGKYLRPVYNLVFGYMKNNAEADALTQSAFVYAWKNLNKFKPEYKFKTWLYEIAKNTALDHLKKKKPIFLTAFDETAKVVQTLCQGIGGGLMTSGRLINFRQVQIELCLTTSATQGCVA